MAVPVFEFWIGWLAKAHALTNPVVNWVFAIDEILVDTKKSNNCDGMHVLSHTAILSALNMEMNDCKEGSTINRLFTSALLFINTV